MATRPTHQDHVNLQNEILFFVLRFYWNDAGKVFWQAVHDDKPSSCDKGKPPRASLLLRRSFIGAPRMVLDFQYFDSKTFWNPVESQLYVGPMERWMGGKIYVVGVGWTSEIRFHMLRRWQQAHFWCWSISEVPHNRSHTCQLLPGVSTRIQWQLHFHTVRSLLPKCFIHFK